MLFIDNKYTTWYYSIIKSATSRLLSKTSYTERHHIIPRSLGGNNSLKNIVRLSAREHFICHLLLTKMVIGLAKSKMVLAVWMFTVTSDNQQRHKITNRQYEILKLKVSAAKRGVISPKKGTKVIDTDQLLTIKHAAHRREEKYASGELIRHTPKPCSDAQRIKFAEDMKSKPTFTTKGYKHTAETKQKISLANSKPRGPAKIPKALACCMCCRKVVAITNFSRWHGDNCRIKVIKNSEPRIRKTTKGYKHTAESKQKISVAAARLKGPRKTPLSRACCMCCRKVVAMNNFNRWHGVNCQNSLSVKIIGLAAYCG